MTPTCLVCGRPLVFIALIVNDSIYKTWQCDCEYRDEEHAPEGIIADIMRAREWDGGSIVIKELGE